jgi:hypothetical protein
MSTDSLPPRRPFRRARAALPPLPRGIRHRDLEAGWAIERVFGKEVLPQLSSEAALARLIARAEARFERYRKLSCRAFAEVFRLRLEVALIGRLPPKIVERWRREALAGERASEGEAAEFRKLATQLLALEPGPRAWLRRQLGTLTPRDGA